MEVTREFGTITPIGAGMASRTTRQHVRLIGHSQPMVSLQAEIDRVSRSDAKVLISGESGVGKEIVARMIHYTGPRANMTFAPVNCAGLPETLLESELSGTSRAASPARIATSRASSSPRTWAPCSSTRSAR